MRVVFDLFTWWVDRVLKYVGSGGYKVNVCYCTVDVIKNVNSMNFKSYSSVSFGGSTCLIKI